MQIKLSTPVSRTVGVAQEQQLSHSHSRQQREEETEQWALKMATNAPADQRPVCWLLLRLDKTHAHCSTGYKGAQATYI